MRSHPSIFHTKKQLKTVQTGIIAFSKIVALFRLSKLLLTVLTFCRSHSIGHCTVDKTNSILASCLYVIPTHLWAQTNGQLREEHSEMFVLKKSQEKSIDNFFIFHLPGHFITFQLAIALCHLRKKLQCLHKMIFHGTATVWHQLPERNSFNCLSEHEKISVGFWSQNAVWELEP